MALFSWSKTASSNATADSTINWAEGQAPSSINDSARAMMARVAEWRDDIASSITTGGTSTAYTVTSNQVFDTLAHLDGKVIGFIPHATNGGGAGTQVTLNVDGLGAKPIRTAPSVDIQSGVLIQGTPYIVTYVNADSAFYLRNMPNPYAIPVGGLLPYVGSSAPNTAFALPFGQAISRTTYATLFSLVSTTFGTGDGSTTFNLPDLRGRSVFGLDNMGGSAASRIGSVVTDSGTIVGSTLGSTGGSATHTLTIAEMPSHDHGGATGGVSLGTFLGNTAAVAVGGNTRIQLSNANSGDLTTNFSTVAANGGGTGSISAQGGGSAHAQLPPAMMLPFILRVI